MKLRLLHAKFIFTISKHPLDRTGVYQNRIKSLDECSHSISPPTFECLCIFRLAADMMPDMMSLAEISRPGLTLEERYHVELVI